MPTIYKEYIIIYFIAVDSLLALHLLADATPLIISVPQQD